MPPTPGRLGRPLRSAAAARVPVSLASLAPADSRAHAKRRARARLAQPPRLDNGALGWPYQLDIHAAGALAVAFEAGVHLERAIRVVGLPHGPRTIWAARLVSPGSQHEAEGRASGRVPQTWRRWCRFGQSAHPGRRPADDEPARRQAHLRIEGESQDLSTPCAAGEQPYPPKNLVAVLVERARRLALQLGQPAVNGQQQRHVAETALDCADQARGRRRAHNQDRERTVDISSSRGAGTYAGQCC